MERRRVGERRPVSRKRPRNDERPLEDFWRTLVKEDLDFIWRCSYYVAGLPPWLKGVLDACVHKHPLRDISLVTWVAFAVALAIWGFPFLWVTVANIACTGVLRTVVAAPRPFMYDGRLRPKADRSPGSHGLPSLETHMAVVVFGWIALKVGHPLLWAGCIAWVVLVGFTRVYAYSRFAHQVACSWVSGTIGLALGLRMLKRLDRMGLSYRHHMGASYVTIFIAVGLLSLWIESGDSRLAGVRKDEYVRVLGGIMDAANSSAAQAELPDVTSGEDPSSGSPPEVEGARGGRHQPPKGQRVSSRQKTDKHDSFYHLQRTMERRTIENREIKRHAEYRRMQVQAHRPPA